MKVNVFQWNNILLDYIKLFGLAEFIHFLCKQCRVWRDPTKLSIMLYVTNHEFSFHPYNQMTSSNIITQFVLQSKFYNYSFSIKYHDDIYNLKHLSSGKAVFQYFLSMNVKRAKYIPFAQRYFNISPLIPYAPSLHFNIILLHLRV